MTFEIVSNIPFPENQLERQRNEGIGATVKKLRVGDSFLLPGAKIKTTRTYISKLGSQNAIRLTCRDVDGGVRVWRLA